MVDLKKNPAIVYVLIFLVVIIWSVIFLKIFTFETSDGIQGKAKINKGEGQKIFKKKFEYELLLSYGDPFVLSGSEQYSSMNNYSNPSSDYNAEREYASSSPDLGGENQAVKSICPKIEYFGMFWNTTKNKKVAILKVDGQKNIIEEGTMSKGVRVAKIERDSIITYYNDLKIISKIK